MRRLQDESSPLVVEMCLVGLVDTLVLISVRISQRIVRESRGHNVG